MSPSPATCSDASQVVAWIQEVFPDELLYTDASGATPEAGQCGPRLTAEAPTAPTARPNVRPNVVTMSELEAPVWMMGFSLPPSYGATDPIGRLATAWMEGRVDDALSGPRFRDAQSDCEYVSGPVRAATVCWVSLPGGLAGDDVSRRVLASIGAVDTLADQAELVTFAAQRLRTDIALSLDTLSPLYSDEALRDTLSNHYTGTPDWFTQALTATDAIDNTQLATFAHAWMRPELARQTVVIRPTDDVRVVMTGDAVEIEDATESTGDADATGTRVAEVAEHDVAQHHRVVRDGGEAVSADVSDVQLAAPTVSYLPNGLTVVVLPHGRVPMVQTALRVAGARSTEARPGLDAWAWDPLGIHFGGFPNRSMTQAQDALSARFWMAEHTDARLIGTTGSAATLDGQLWMLRNFAGSAHTIESTTYRQLRTGRVRLTERRLDDRPKVTVATAQRAHLLGAEHPSTPSFVESRSLGSHAPIGKVKKHVRELWRPSNATLYITGAVDPASTVEQVRRWFGDWSGGAGPSQQRGGPPMRSPTSRAAYIVVNDADEDSTQTRLRMGCRVDPSVGEAAHAVGVEWLRERTWAVLRESDVAAYDPSVRAWHLGAERVVWVEATVAPERAGAGATALDALLSEVQAGPSAEQVTRIGAGLRARWAQRYVDTTDVLDALVRDGADVRTVARSRPEELATVDVSAVATWGAMCAPGAALTVVGPDGDVLVGTPWESVTTPALRLKDLRE